MINQETSMATKPTRNPRVEVMTILADVRRRAGALQSNTRAEAATTVYSAPDLGPNETRKRRPEEYPEQNPAYWERVAIIAQYLQQYADRMLVIAQDEHTRLTSGGPQ